MSLNSLVLLSHAILVVAVALNGVRSLTKTQDVRLTLVAVWTWLGTLDLIWALIYLIIGDVESGVGDLGGAAVSFFLVWLINRRNRNRKWGLKAIGAKARALLTKVSDVARRLSDGVRVPLPRLAPSPA